MRVRASVLVSALFLVVAWVIALVADASLLPPIIATIVVGAIAAYWFWVDRRT